MTIRKDLQAKNGHRAVTIVAEDNESIIVRDHKEVRSQTEEVLTQGGDQRRLPFGEDPVAER